MLITQLKAEEYILSLAEGKTVLLNCFGCSEVFFPEEEAHEMQSRLQQDGRIPLIIDADYICSPKNLQLSLLRYKEDLADADTIIIFSCGAGVQAAAEYLSPKKVCAACDTFSLPGFAGVTPAEYDCRQCGECLLNYTGGICPISSCAKSLTNGQCGGSENGKCETDKNMACGWEMIYRKLEKTGRLDILKHPPNIRSFGASTASDTGWEQT